MINEEVEARLLADSERDEDTGCLRWRGSVSPKGYGRMTVDGRSVAVHRLAHRVWIGPIPQGLEIDHVAARGCRHRDCIEPAHLEAVTHAENLRRRVNVPQSKITHCPMGHPYDEANTSWIVTADGYDARRCRQCRRDRNSRLVECSECGQMISDRHMSRHRKRKHTVQQNSPEGEK